MLIQALSEYYDVLSRKGKVLPPEYSKVKIHYVIALTEDGKIDMVLNKQDKVQIPAGKNKTKDKLVPAEMRMPKRTEKSGIEANIAEHRPLYIFGLNMEEDRLNPDDRTQKARKSHKAFVEKNLEFTERMESSVVKAFRNFLLNWKPEEETENPHLLSLGKDYGKSGFAFCLSGFPDRLLHEEPEMQEKWKMECEKKVEEGEEAYTAQCAVSGKEAPIARIHGKIKGIYGGLATGSVLIGFNNPSENSYGNEQSYNSNISEEIMRKYTEALNYLLGSEKHKVMLDETTVVFWAMDGEEACENLLMQMLLGQNQKMDAEQTERMLKHMLGDAGKDWKLTEERLKKDGIKPDVDFYMLGLKPNSSRLSVKFLIRRKYADVLWNIARFQKDMQITEDFRPVSLGRLKMELISPKSSNDKIHPALLARIFEAVLSGGRYPTFLLATAVRRVKTDEGKISPVRAGIIKACINRADSKEELKVGLDKENKNQAYLCGRLFAVLERTQQSASNNSLNRTIKDAYFSAAASKPALVFPKLIMLAQNHLRKAKSAGYYNILITEIIGELKGEFPKTLLLEEQGKFIIGYYQQYQKFFEKTEKETEEM